MMYFSFFYLGLVALYFMSCTLYSFIYLKKKNIGRGLPCWFGKKNIYSSIALISRLPYQKYTPRVQGRAQRHIFPEKKLAELVVVSEWS